MPIHTQRVLRWLNCFIISTAATRQLIDIVNRRPSPPFWTVYQRNLNTDLCSRGEALEQSLKRQSSPRTPLTLHAKHPFAVGTIDFKLILFLFLLPSYRQENKKKTTSMFYSIFKLRYLFLWKKETISAKPLYKSYFYVQDAQQKRHGKFMGLILTCPIKLFDLGWKWLCVKVWMKHLLVRPV